MMGVGRVVDVFKRLDRLGAVWVVVVLKHLDRLGGAGGEMGDECDQTSGQVG